MAVRPVLKMGEPRLFEVSEAVSEEEFETVELRSLIADMFDTMAALEGAGLAAPQIGILKRVVIFGVAENSRYPQVEPVPMTVLINPVVEVLDTATEEDWEGCLSVPGMRGLVERASHIRYSGYSETGAPLRREAKGFHARVVQHECDHLDGILYPMRIPDLRNFGYEDALFPEQPH